MKKVLAFACLLIVIVVACFIIWNGRAVSTIYLDINPSIQLKLDKNNNVKSVIALNEDAKDVINSSLKGISLDDSINLLTKELIDKGYIDSNQVSILLYSTGDIDNEKIESIIVKSFDDTQIAVEVIIVEKITKEDEKLAKKYNISPSKASYINSITNDNKNIEVDALKDKSVNEIKETKETGKYCDKDYFLEGDWCLKEINRVNAKNGDVCPNGYFEKGGKCYEETYILESDKLICNKDFSLKDGKCYRTITQKAEAIYECSKGELAKDNEYLKRGVERPICVDKTNAKAPTLRCLKQPHKIIGGKCYVGPAPTINGGCPNGDKLVGGGCYSLDPEDQWLCPNGDIYEKSKGTYVELCPDTFTYTKPTIVEYKCEEGFTIKGSKCIKEEVEDAYHERYCKTGYTLVDNARCMNLNNKKDKQKGYYCEEENSRLKGKMCVIYDIVEAHK